ncbi:MAG: M4 family metallopeptidase, partial [Bacteroidota bacterium]
MGTLTAQVFQGPAAVKIIPDAELIWQNEDNGSLKFVRFSDQSCITKAQGESWLQSTLNHRSKDVHKQYEVREDAFGMIHHRYRQYYEGVQVLHGVFYLHYKGNLLYAANGEHYPNIDIPTSPSVSEAAALAVAKANLPAKAFGWKRSPQGAEDPQAELFVMADSVGSYHLAYRFDLKVASPFGRYYVLVDAHSGEFLQKYDRIHTAESEGTAETKYRGTRQMKTDSTAPGNFRLRDYTRGAGVETYDLNTGTNYNSAIDFTDTDDYWNVTLNQDDAAYDCHWGTQWTYDYFLNEHNLDSYDGNGTILKSYVHYGFNFLNAFWNGSVMTYGDGDGAGATALTSIDIVAHELTHGITEYSAGLIYMNESGALNESFSDIFGVVLDFYTDSTAANWLMGDEIGFTFRNASNPNQFNHPDTYFGDFWYSGPLDNGGVHWNSGVQNFWFYLLSRGGVGTNDNGDPYTVPAIGMAKAADIAFRNLTVYLTPSSQHADARFFAIQSANDLFGNCSDELIATTNAWHAAGVGLPFNNAVIAGFDPSQTFACVTPANISFSNNSFNSTGYLWDFGDGNTSTLATPTHTYAAAGTYTVTLIANGIALCGNSDTLVENNLITVSNVGGPLAANCTPPSISGGASGAGIYNVSFGAINHTTDNGIDGYQDYTCSHQTTVTEGLSYPVSITTGPNTPEDVKIWLDLDNDGVFSNPELVFVSDNVLQ